MAITPIDSLSTQIAETKARGIEGREEGQRQREQALSRGIGASVQGGIQSAGTALAGEIDIQKKREAEELLKSGAQGIGQYAQEVGLDPTVYVSMANNVSDPKSFADIYKLMKTKAEKKSTDEDVMSFAQKVEALGRVDDDATFERSVNTLVPDTASGGEDAQKRKQSMLKSLRENRVSKAKGSKGGPKEIIDLRKLFTAESKGGDEILRQTDVLRTAFNDGAFRDTEGNVNRVGSDQALIMTFNKILDPTSVVRESEFNRTPEAAGAMNRAQGWFAKLIEGGSGLTEVGRKAIFKMSELISQGAMTNRFIKIDEFKEIDPKNLKKIVPGFAKYAGQYEEWRKDPEAYKLRIASELNEALDMAAKEEVAPTGTKQVATEKPEDSIETRRASLATKKARLAELKAKRGAK